MSQSSAKTKDSGQKHSVPLEPFVGVLADEPLPTETLDETLDDNIQMYLDIDQLKNELGLDEMNDR